MPIRKLDYLPSRSFGIEIEFSDYWGMSINDLGEDLRQRIRTYRNGFVNINLSHFHSDGIVWDLKRDGSCGYELASPRLNWSWWEQVAIALEVLNRHKVVTNNGLCSLHVHHAIADFTNPQITRLALLWWAIEEIGFGLVNEERRYSPYCRSFKRGVLETWDRLLREVSTNTRLRRRISRLSRRTALNLTQYWRRGTAEFRLHHGTTDEVEIRQWVLFTQTIVELAKRQIHRRTIAQLAESNTMLLQLEALQQLIDRYFDVEAITEMANNLPEYINKNNPNLLLPPKKVAKIAVPTGTWDWLSRDFAAQYSPLDDIDF